MKNSYGIVAGLMASLVLAGCGGGGDDGGGSTAMPTPAPVATTPTNPAPTPAAATAEGVYQGTVSNGLTQFSLVLETGDVYVLYGQMVNTVFGVGGFLRGSGKSTSGAFTASDVREYTSAASSTIYTINGTYVADASLNGTLAGGQSNLTFTGATLANSTYVYNTAAKLADISGAWTVTDLTGARVTLNIGTDGKFTGTSNGCAITGSLAPRASGKNVFDLTLVFGAAPCSLPGKTATGVALNFTIGAQHQLIAAVTDATRAYGTALIGAR